MRLSMLLMMLLKVEVWRCSSRCEAHMKVAVAMCISTKLGAVHSSSDAGAYVRRSAFGNTRKSEAAKQRNSELF